MSAGATLLLLLDGGGGGGGGAQPYLDPTIRSAISFMYLSGRSHFLLGDIDASSPNVKARPTNLFYLPTADAPEEFVADVPGAAWVDAGVGLNSPAVISDPTAGWAGLTSTGVTLPGIAADVVRALVIYLDTGSDATSPLIAYLGRRADLRPLAEPSDDGLDVTFPSDLVFTI